MQNLHWCDDYRVGHPVIDEQHRRIIDLCEAMGRARFDSSADDMAMLVVIELGEYIHYHFAEEERLMARAFYPGLEAHAAVHREFTEKVERMMGELQDGLVRFEDVYHVLVEWVQAHILNSDQDYVPFLRRAQAG